MQIVNPNCLSSYQTMTPPPLPRLPRPPGLFTFDPVLLNEVSLHTQVAQVELVCYEVTGRPPPFTRDNAGHWSSFYASPGLDVSEFPLEPEISDEEEELLMLRFANGSQMLSLTSLESDYDYTPEVKKSRRDDESPSVVYDRQQQLQPDIVRHSQLQLEQLQHLFPSACAHPALSSNLYRLPCCQWRMEEEQEWTKLDSDTTKIIQWLPPTPASLSPSV